MRLREQILAEHSKANTSRIVKWIGSDQARFDQLFKLFIQDEDLVVQRAAWPLSYAAIANPSFITKHFDKLLRNLRKPGIHDSVKRNTMRLLQEMEIPKKYHGEVMNVCFNNISSPIEKPSIKAFSLTVLENLSRHYPEISQELRTIIEDRWELETPAFRSRAKNILRKI